MNKMIFCTDKHGGIGYNNTLPWHSTADMQNFKKETLHHKVLMGYNTWISLPPKHRILSDRLNIVCTSRPIEDKYCDHNFTGNNLIFISTDEVQNFLYNNDGVVIIGGKTLYDKYYDMVDCIVHSTIGGDYQTDTSIDVQAMLKNFVCTNTSILEDGVIVNTYYKRN